jgi:hypothetical protein
MTDGVYRAECEDCGYSYEDERRHFVEQGAENHESVYRTHPDDHDTTVRYVSTDTSQDGGSR